MAKLWLLAVSVLWLTGCAVGPSSTDLSVDSPASETFLVQSKNYPRLTEYYKNQLKKRDTISTRLKLAQAYIDSNDNESALFTLASVITNSKADGTAFYLQGVAQYKLGKLEQSLRSLEVAVQKSPNDARSINMLGVAQAELGMLKQARESFNHARELMYDDLAVKNNLALLDMLEGDFKQAAARLMPIYINTPSKADPKLRANLAIIVAKLGSFETLKSLYADKYSDAELFDIFQNLRASEPATKTSKSTITRKSNDLPAIAKNQLIVKAGATQFESEKRELLREPSERNTVPDDVASTPLLQATPKVNHAPIHAESSGKPVIKKSESGLDSTAEKRIDDEVTDIPDSVFLSQVTPQYQRSHENTLAQTSKQEARDTYSELTGIERRYDRSAPATKMSEPQPIPLPINLSNTQQKSPIADKQAFSNSVLGIKREFSAPVAVEPANDAVQINEPLDKYAEPLVASSKQQKSSAKKWEFVPLSNYNLKHEGGLNIPVAQFRHHGNLIDITLDSDATIIAVEQ
ncbi:tetratricopeptide repeat protein [Marinomonas gallaica]|uniref:tetratricopeptide repeat protein n=1 Tax=Marinomonas gallaica TaxID=1806667 RepID=UPI003A9278F9